LRRLQAQIPSHAELHPVGVVRAKEIIAFVWMLPGFRNVHWNPSFSIDIEIGPAVISGDLAGMLVRRKRESDLEARWDALRARHSDE
jgi:hypothetical protein